ncbi:MAG: hypothetical protein HFF62_14365 [Oscillospiraceae bacterium]|nr:hypothetical protein [Oscillospiraceae bacterium]
MKSKILIVLSLLVIAALAVPLGLMTAAILRGESPRQLAEKEQMAEGLPDEEQQPDVSEPASGQSLPYPKPVVPPDPGPAPQAEPEPEAEPEPAPAARSSTRKKKSNPAPKSPAAQEPAKPAYVLPKAVLGPNEAPCMVDGLDGYAYDYQ